MARATVILSRNPPDVNRAIRQIGMAKGFRHDNPQFKPFRKPRLPQDSKHGDGIDGRYERAKQKAVDKFQGQTQPPGNAVEKRPDNERGYNAAGSRKDPDLLLLFQQFSEVDMKRAGKEQETKHPHHKGLIEVDVPDEGEPVFLDAETQRSETADNKHTQRHQHGDEHDPDRSGQLYEPAVHIAEDDRKGDQYRDDV